MAIRQTRIYAPKNHPYDDQNWAETMMARVIKPVVEKQQGLNWFWFTRYSSEQPEFADSDGANAPADFFNGQWCRSLRLRVDVDDSQRASLESQADALIKAEGCWNADWRDYGIEELCSGRFLGEDQSDARRMRRLAIVRDYTHSVSRLALDALIPADSQGRFRFEFNSQSPHKSAFFGLHHLFCNTTEPLLTVLVGSDGSNLVCGTRQYPPDLLKQTPIPPFVEFRVRF